MSTSSSSDPGYADAAPHEPQYAEAGPGSVATFGARLLAFFVDAVLADLLAIIANGGYHVGGRQALASYLAFLLIELVFIALAGQTPGMKVVGVAVVRDADGGRPAFKWVLARTVLVALVAPALIIDATGRAMHDRAAGTVMLRTR